MPTASTTSLTTRRPVRKPVRLAVVDPAAALYVRLSNASDEIGDILANVPLSSALVRRLVAVQYAIEASMMDADAAIGEAVGQRGFDLVMRKAKASNRSACVDA